MSRRPRVGQRLAAVVALLLLCCLAVPFVGFAEDLEHVLVVVGCLFAATYFIWLLITRRGIVRLLAVPAVAAALTGQVLFALRHWLELVGWVVTLALFGAAGRIAVRDDGTATPVFTARAVPRASRGVLIVNPRSGGGKAAKVGLADEAGRRGIETVLLEPGTDLRDLVKRAIAGGADVVGMAGGDGSQGLVAGLAMTHDVAHVCVPAGTLNHFARDLGLDRDDVLGALDAFTDGMERRIDLARVNDRVFVNNASLGVYAGVVQSASYRSAKLATWGRVLPDLLGPGATAIDLRFAGPDDQEHSRASLVVVSNNPYDVSRMVGAGTRPRLDTEHLGILVAQLRNADEVARFVTLSTVGQGRRMRDVMQWAATEFEVRSGESVPIGLDGEALRLEPPLVFVSLPGALRVRLPERAARAAADRVGVRVSRRDIERLVRIAAGRS